MNKPASPPDALDIDLQNQWLKLKDETRQFLSKTIKYPQFTQAFESIRDTHKMSGTAGTGMLLMGAPGVGKTTILAHYVNKHLAERTDLETETLTKIPIIRLSIPSKPTIKSLIVKMLITVEHISTTGTQSNLEKRLGVVIKEQKVELIIFDEFQHLLREQAQCNTRHVVNFIKLLMDDYKLAVVMAGIPEGYKSISNYDELYQRFTYEQVHMRPLDLPSESGNRAFNAYIQTCENILKQAGVKTIALAKDEMLLRLHLATAGKVRLISRLIVKVLEKTDLSSRLVLSDFAQAYERTRLNPSIGTFNPFLANMDKVREKALGKK